MQGCSQGDPSSRRIEAVGGEVSKAPLPSDWDSIWFDCAPGTISLQGYSPNR